MKKLDPFLFKFVLNHFNILIVLKNKVIDLVFIFLKFKQKHFFELDHYFFFLKIITNNLLVQQVLNNTF